MTWDWLDERPIVVAIAGPNGAGKTTFYHAHIGPSGLRFVNADQLAKELDIDAYAAAKVADSIRRELVQQRESFAFETVFSDPVGDKVNFLKEAADAGFHVAMCFIGISNIGQSEQRVAMRVSQGGHDVPTEKLKSRFPRTLTNLKMAITALPRVLVFDNGDLSDPYRRVAAFENGTAIDMAKPIPPWLRRTMP